MSKKTKVLCTECGREILYMKKMPTLKYCKDCASIKRKEWKEQYNLKYYKAKKYICYCIFYSLNK